MLMSVYYARAYLEWYVRVRLYTQRGFLHCLFESSGFPRTSKGG